MLLRIQSVLLLLSDGMTAFFNVQQCGVDVLPDTPPGKRRRYFIAAQEVNWNYMPGGKDLFTSGKVEMDHGFSRFVNPKVIYRFCLF